MKIKDLESVSILGTGLLGGSLGLAIGRAYPWVRRAGYSHRASTRAKAMESGVVDECFETAGEAVAGCQMVVLASPIGTFGELMEAMGKSLAKGAVVTDVGSTKVLPAAWAKKHLPRGAAFVGSHPMAGSEQRGVEFARADLFEGAHCIITPTKGSRRQAVSLLEAFWQGLGMLVCRMSPREHDRILARISHLPHVLAAALVNCSKPEEMLLCGKGFLDTTRIASGPANVWRDILMANAHNTGQAIEGLIKELKAAREALGRGDEGAVTRFLERARVKREELVDKKLRRKELPT